MSQGSFPGLDPREPVRICAGENPGLPAVPELPARGPGGDMIGRALALLARVAPDYAAETTPAGWRLAGRTSDAASRPMRRAAAWLGEDLDVAEEGYAGAPAVKVALAGPWTLAASVDLRSGHRILSDPGAVRELLAAYPAMLTDWLPTLARRWPATVLQIDEPALPQVLAARVATPSGMDFYRGVSAEAVRDGLGAAVAAAHALSAQVVLHCCAVPAPVRLLLATGADAVSLDLLRQTPDGRGGQDEEVLGALLESQGSLVAGVVPWQEAGPAEPVAASANRVLDLLNRTGVPLDACAPRLAVSTACGLAGASPDGARAITARAAAVAAILRKEART